MAETIETIYTEDEVADLRASGHWPAQDVLETQDEADKAAAPATSGKRAADTSTPA